MAKIYTTGFHPRGLQASPWFEIKGDKIYTTGFHPDGLQAAPWFEIRD